MGAYCPQSPEKMNERRNNVYERYMSPTPEKLLNANESLLAKAICEAGNKGPKFGAEKAAKLREAAGSAQVIGVRSASNASLIKNVLDIIEGLLAAIQRIEGEIKELVTQDTRLDEDVKLLCSIPGIGFSSAVVIVAEIGNISLFGKPNLLTNSLSQIEIDQQTPYLSIIVPQYLLQGSSCSGSKTMPPSLKI